MGLIDATNAMESIDEIVCSMSVCINMDYCHGMTAMKDAAIHAIERQPTVDAVPVIHAKWVQNPYSDEPPKCSHCGFESSYYYDRSKSVIENRNGVLLSEAKSKYCPNCGAKMRGEHDEQ